MDSSTLPGNVIFRLPYELLLAVFRQLPDQLSINALAEAHPALAVVRRENEDSIRKAMRYNFMAEFARKATGHASLHLMRIILPMCTLLAHCRLLSLRESSFEFKPAADYFSDSWVVSGRDLRRLKGHHIKGYIQKYCTVTCELTSCGFFIVAPNLDSWYNERFAPVAKREYLKRRPKPESIAYRVPTNITDVEVLIAVELWCITSRHYSNTAPSVQTFLSMFAPEFSLRVVQFAQCFMRGRGNYKIWKIFQRQWGDIMFPEMIPAMRELSGVSEEEDPMDELEIKQGPSFRKRQFRESR